MEETDIFHVKHGQYFTSGCEKILYISNLEVPQFQTWVLILTKFYPIILSRSRNIPNFFKGGVYWQRVKIFSKYQTGFWLIGEVWLTAMK